MIAQARAITTKHTKVHEIKAEFAGWNFVRLVVDMERFDLF
jgi:hypothetical protein